MSQTIGIHEARAQFSRLIDRVEAGETIIISRAGKPVAELRAVGPKTPAEAVARIRAFRDRYLNRDAPLLQDNETIRDLVTRGHRY